jgi:hypothetical protein
MRWRWDGENQEHKSKSLPQRTQRVTEVVSGSVLGRIPCSGFGRATERGVLRLRQSFASRSSYFAQDDRGGMENLRVRGGAGGKWVPLRLRRFGMTSLFLCGGEDDPAEFGDAGAD